MGWSGYVSYSVLALRLTSSFLICDHWYSFSGASSSFCVLVDKWVSLRNRTQTSPIFMVLRCVPSISWARNPFLWIWPWGIPHFWTHVPETWPNPKGGRLRIVFVRSHDGSLAKELSNWADASLQCWLLTEIAENRLERNQANPSGIWWCEKDSIVSSLSFQNPNFPNLTAYFWIFFGRDWNPRGGSVYSPTSMIPKLRGKCICNYQVF